MKQLYVSVDKYFVLLCLFLSIGIVQANNIQITTKPTLINKNELVGDADIFFKFKWQNSWRISKLNSWDAAWVFVKYRESGNEWLHIYLDKNDTAHRVKANVPALLKTASSMVTKEGGTSEEEAVGVFLYRQDPGVGDFIFDSVCLHWNYSEQGLDQQSVVSLRVFVLEMVYVPQAPFYFGYSPTQGTATNSSDIAIHPDSTIIYPINGASPLPFKAPGGASYSVFDASASANVWYPSAPSPFTANNVKNAEGYVVEASDWVKVHRNSANTWALANVPLWQRTTNSSTWTYRGTDIKSVPSWHEIKIEMPSPYLASHFYSRWTAGNVPSGFYVEGSQDGSNWELLAGQDAIDIFTTTTFPANFDLELENTKDTVYRWYKFNYFTAGQIYLGAYGPMDKMLKGSYDTRNQFYYNLGRPYSGAMPLKVLRSAMTWTGSTAPTMDQQYIYSSPNYPNGHQAFYMMKHELSQQAYMDFLNSLNVAQQKERAGAANPVALNSPRFSAQDRCWVKLREVATSGPAVYGLMPDVWEGGKGGSPYAWDDLERNGANIAMSCLGWNDIAAYLCWAGLRPLTEMEYEKACRGTLRPVHNEYAWGMPNSVNSTNTAPLNYNFSDEIVSPPNANFIMQHSSTNFPLRVGCLASEESTRADAGVGYYGALNLSDNVSEYYISVTHPIGLQFDGTHGSGTLNGMGQAEIATWPNNINAYGLIVRGVYSNDVNNAQVSNRYWKNTAPQVGYGNRYMGCRGGRTAPN